MAETTGATRSEEYTNAEDRKLKARELFEDRLRDKVSNANAKVQKELSSMKSDDAAASISPLATPPANTELNLLKPPVPFNIAALELEDDYKNIEGSDGRVGTDHIEHLNLLMPPVPFNMMELEDDDDAKNSAAGKNIEGPVVVGAVRVDESTETGQGRGSEIEMQQAMETFVPVGPEIINDNEARDTLVPTAVNTFGSGPTDRRQNDDAVPIIPSTPSIRANEKRRK